MKRIILFILSSLICIPLFPQKTKTVEGEYTYNPPENISIEEARRIALNRAKVQALADKFGTIITQSNNSIIESNNGKSDINLFSINESEVKGEWIKTIGEPKYNIMYEDGMLLVSVKVKGLARERLLSTIDFQTKLLRNGTEDKYESSVFKNEDDFYLSFLSPVSGFLAVYLINAERQAFCLLPYRSQTEGIYPIKSNKRYLFFSCNDAPDEEKKLVDEYQMTCDGTTETNLIYIIYSPNEFTKAADQQIGDSLPRQLAYEDFLKWLAKCRTVDKKMIEKCITITVSK